MAPRGVENLMQGYEQPVFIRTSSITDVSSSSSSKRRSLRVSELGLHDPLPAHLSYRVDQLVFPVQLGDVVAAPDALAADQDIGNGPSTGRPVQLGLQLRSQRMLVQLNHEGCRHDAVLVEKDGLGFSGVGTVAFGEDDDCGTPSSASFLDISRWAAGGHTRRSLQDASQFDLDFMLLRGLRLDFLRGPFRASIPLPFCYDRLAVGGLFSARVQEVGLLWERLIGYLLDDLLGVFEPLSDLLIGHGALRILFPQLLHRSGVEVLRSGFTRIRLDDDMVVSARPLHHD